MKTMKFLSLAALALTFAACSNEDNEMAQQAEQPDNNMITITATLAPKSSDAQTRAVNYDGTKVEVDWAVNEHLAILYEVSSVKKLADARITAVDGTGTATIEFTVDGLTVDGTACTIVYPLAAAKADYSGVKAYADMLATQNGTLNANLDVRVGAGKIMTGTPDLDVTTQPAAQYSIFRFTLKDLSGTNKNSSQFIVSDNSGNVITTVTVGSFPFHVALPAMAAGTYWFNATIESKPYIAKATLSSATVAGKFYPSIVKMATIGDVIKSDGKFYAAGTAGAVAKITYLGNDAETDATFNHGLALALDDVSDTKTWCSQTSVTCLGTQYDNSTKFNVNDLAGIANTDALVGHAVHTHAAASAARGYNGGTHPTGTSAWFLPSAGQWDKMATAAGSYANLKTNAGLQELASYWSSTEYDASHAWFFDYNVVDWLVDNKDRDYRVRACLAF